MPADRRCTPDAPAVASAAAPATHRGRTLSSASPAGFAPAAAPATLRGRPLPSAGPAGFAAAPATLRGRPLPSAATLPNDTSTTVSPATLRGRPLPSTGPAGVPAGRRTLPSTGPAAFDPAGRRLLSSTGPASFDFGSLDSRCAPTTGSASGAHRAGFAASRALGTPLPIAAPPAISNPVRAAAIGVHTTPVARVAALAARSGTLVFAPVAGPRAAVEPAAGARAPAQPTTDASPERTALDLAAIDPATTVELTHETIAALIAEAADPAPSAPPAPARTAPGPIAAAADPAAVGWRDLPDPDRQPPWAPRSPVPWHHRRPPRIELVVFLLIGTLLCGLLAPFCWSVASTELGGIKRGAVEDHHRGLLALAQIWGALATCILIVVCCYALSAVAGTSAHGA